jgi:tetratricopeptide (TPR) repeat protein
MAHFRAAESALRRYEFTEALREFESSLRVWPNSVPTRLKAARTARRADQLERAEEHLAACEKDGITPETALERFLLSAQRGELSEIEGTLSHMADEKHPETVLIWEAVAKGCMQVHRDRQAIHLWSLVVKMNPDLPDAHFWLGTQLERARFMIDAIPGYQRAVELAPQRPLYRVALANALIGFKKPSEAWPHFQELLRQSPHDPGVLLGAARCQNALGQLSAAQAYLDTLLRDFPDHADGWAERGRVCRDQGNGDEALRCLRKAFALAPNNHKIGYTLLTELRAEKKTEEANALSEKIERMTRDGQRLDELNAQLRKVQRSAPLRCEIGTIYMNHRQEAEAVRWLRGALQDDPDYKPAHEALVDYYERIGHPESARYHRQRANIAKP